MYSYAYLIWALAFLPLWLLFFIARKDFRKPIIILGLIFAVGGPLTEWLGFLKNYWNPLATISPLQFVLEELLYIFLLGGALFFLYPLLFKVDIGQRINVSRLAIVLASSLVVFFLAIALGLKSFDGIFLGQVPVAIYAWITHPNLIKISLFNFVYGCILAFYGFNVLLFFFPNIVPAWWLTQNLWGIYLHGVPLEEIVWLGFVGLGYGVLPEFVFE